MHPKQHYKLGLSCQICIANKDAQALADFQDQVLSGKKRVSSYADFFFMSLSNKSLKNKEGIKHYHFNDKRTTVLR